MDHCHFVRKPRKVYCAIRYGHMQSRLSPFVPRIHNAVKGVMWALTIIGIAYIGDFVVRPFVLELTGLFPRLLGFIFYRGSLIVVFALTSFAIEKPRFRANWPFAVGYVFCVLVALAVTLVLDIGWIVQRSDGFQKPIQFW